jgi:hypothetical protein
MHVAKKSVEKKERKSGLVSRKKKENKDSPCFLAKFISSKREIYF